MWDYLIITASNDSQAKGYQKQLDIRKELGLLSQVRNTLVIADPGGKRIGSGGSTLFCLSKVIESHLENGDQSPENILKKLRILIVHAGGDSKRLPAYGPCGKLFIPVPGNNDTPLPTTLFDKQLPTYLALPKPEKQQGQIIITAGDVLLRFDPDEVVFSPEGITGLAASASPAQASKHGVFIKSEGNKVKKFLQKPTIEQQALLGATNAFGKSNLDIGIMNFDAETAIKLLKVAGFSTIDGKSSFSGERGKALFSSGIDFYQEICCALGYEANFKSYNDLMEQLNSQWPLELRKPIFDDLKDIEFCVGILPSCDFLHFGKSSQITESGLALLRNDANASVLDTCLSINNIISEGSQVNGKDSWVESCKISSKLTLQGNNVISGVDINEPLIIPQKMCVDCTKAKEDNGKSSTFLRIYGIMDGFKRKVSEDALFCNRPVTDWLQERELSLNELWPQVPTKDTEEQTLWTAKLFPSLDGDINISKWLAFYSDSIPNPEYTKKWKHTRRYSLKDIAEKTDQEEFFNRRNRIRAKIIQENPMQLFSKQSGFSAKELALSIKSSDNATTFTAKILETLFNLHNTDISQTGSWWMIPRISHSLGAALEITFQKDAVLFDILPQLKDILPTELLTWLEELTSSNCIKTSDLKAAAFKSMSKSIIGSRTNSTIPLPKNHLRTDEIIWGRAPARMDFGGGWSDTPPYSLIYGGSVMNVAADLNGQPPIHVYARVVPQPVIKIGSIDLGVRIEISTLEDLLNYGQPSSEFGLAKAALALCGFSPYTAKWPLNTTLKKMLTNFGGGIEITTLAAIPKGSGLGTSSIVGAALVAVINRIMGKQLDNRELFYQVLKLEQALTTGGGWQDQLGGVLPGAKLAISSPGITPAPAVNYLPADVVAPSINGGLTMLYYTGVTRLAKNILGKVVSNQFDCDRESMNTLRDIHKQAEIMADCLMKKEYNRFAEGVNTCWQQNKLLDPDSTNPKIEEIIEQIKPYTAGLKLLGAGGGGFLLICAKDSKNAALIRNTLEKEPPNDKARFFDYSINNSGLTVTVC
ncbi:MAG: L-fucokinase [Sedimentisphaeraceae bacterium JB056]